MNRRRSAVIVDDNAAARVLLKHYLTEGHPDITIVGEAGSLAQGIRQVRETRPDVLFLDVELKKVKGKVVESGFDLLKEIEPLRPTVIFTTGFEGYAVRAIRFSAFDYLVKPFDADQLAEVLARLDKEVDDAARPDHPSLHANLQPHDGISLPVVLKGGGVSLELVKKARIIHAQPVARGQNTLVELEGREEVVVT
ncbi:MAG: response regulator, partial [Flavobacteriales bacterium]|nr:response regulator [Flavobacteriales bacterium]